MYNNSFKDFFTGIGGYILVILLVAYSFFVIVAKCNRPKTKDAPETVSKAQYDQAMQINSELTKRLADDSVRFNTVIRELKERDEQWKRMFEQNRISDERLKVKQSGIKKQVENLTIDSLEKAIENF